MTSGTIFAFHKLPLKVYLITIAIFTNAVKGKFGVRYLSNYANEAAYREDTRRLPNGDIFMDIAQKCARTRTHHDA